MRRDLPEVFEIYQETVLPAPPEIVVSALGPLLTDERIARLEAIISQRTRSVAVVLDNLIDPHNIAAILRSADAFGVQEVHVIQGDEPFVASTRITTGAERWLDVVHHPNAQACIDALHQRDFRVYVAAVDGDLTPDDLPKLQQVAIIFGNEHAGVNPDTLRYADGTYGIPMKGFVQSLNVSVATAITLHAATAGRSSDLTPADQILLRARFMMLSVRNAEQIVLDYVQRAAR
jgi:tRNA (guanosine-2'-O-)-methyltransferase